MSETADDVRVVAIFKPREETYQLQSLPGGWVQLRRQSYGNKMRRLQLASSVKTEIRSGQQQGDSLPAEIVSALVELTYLAFSSSVVDHNFYGEGGRKLDFRNHQDIDSLDPAVGDEIADLIEKHNAEMNSSDPNLASVSEQN